MSDRSIEVRWRWLWRVYIVAGRAAGRTALSEDKTNESGWWYAVFARTAAWQRRCSRLAVSGRTGEMEFCPWFVLGLETAKMYASVLGRNRLFWVKKDERALPAYSLGLLEEAKEDCNLY